MQRCQNVWTQSVFPSLSFQAACETSLHDVLATQPFQDSSPPPHRLPEGDPTLKLHPQAPRVESTLKLHPQVPRPTIKLHPKVQELSNCIPEGDGQVASGPAFLPDPVVLLS